MIESIISSQLHDQRVLHKHNSQLFLNYFDLVLKLYSDNANTKQIMWLNHCTSSCFLNQHRTEKNVSGPSESWTTASVFWVVSGNSTFSFRRVKNKKGMEPLPFKARSWCKGVCVWCDAMLLFPLIPYMLNIEAIRKACL